LNNLATQYTASWAQNIKNRRNQHGKCLIASAYLSTGSLAGPSCHSIGLPTENLFRVQAQKAAGAILIDYSLESIE